MAWSETLSRLILALWWGSLTSLGAWVVPQLFVHAPTPALAGGLAAHLFSTQNAVGLVAAVLFSGFQFFSGGLNALLWRWQWALVLAVVLAIELSEFLVFPLIMARENLKLWHSVGSGLFLLEWLCLTRLLWQKNATPPEPTEPTERK